ncbi:Holliday junction resolvase RecU [Atopobacter phocae]|uniref:Holliday junction resolvase RecU n=1 Tax=Atopobacter phocae TaxID=136492 RepID=UPI000471EC51|nr:Holliday junction resolvase RecU [Atopobacter phocae]
MINYPNGMNRRTLTHTSTSHARRGMRLEDWLNESNEYYLNRGIAVIHKKPTPIQIVKVDYPKRSAVKITEAYYKEASTTDYNGVYNGLYLDFEAKTTKLKTRFPLDNFSHHQIQHMDACEKQGGISFVIMYFKHYELCYLVPFSLIKEYWDNRKLKQSIPYDVIAHSSFPIRMGYLPRLAYIEAVDHYLDFLKEDSDESIEK